MRTTKSLTPLLVCLLFAAGCAGPIPLFDSNARPLNRVYSGKEVVTELNNSASRLVDGGYVTQAWVDKNVGPVLDRATETLNAAEAVYKAGNVTEATTKLESVKFSLQTLRGILLKMEKRP